MESNFYDSSRNKGSTNCYKNEFMFEIFKKLEGKDGFCTVPYISDGLHLQVGC